MKATLRIPTNEQFAFVEIELDEEALDGTLTADSLYKAYNSYTRVFKGGVGLETKEWNIVLDKYRKGKGMEVDCHERMDDNQKWMIHELDKSDNRINK